jgi:hypothetical protein
MKVVYIAILSSLVLFQGMKGGVVPKGEEYPLVSGFSGHQSSPDLILWSEGGLLAWENTTGKGIKRIVVQSINSEGRVLGDAQVISQNVEGIHDTDPDIEVLDDQRAVLVWSSGRRGQTQIYKAIVNRNGSRVGEIQKVSLIGQNHSFPAVGVCGNGNYMVAWESNDRDGDGKGVYGRLYGKTATASGPEFLLSQSTAGNQSGPIIEGLEGSRFMAGWISGVTTGRDEHGGQKLRSFVMGRFFDGAQAQGNEFRVSGSDVIARKITSTECGPGQLCVGWMQITDLNSQDKFDIWSVTIDAGTGVALGEPQKVNHYSTHTQKNPTVLSHHNETVFVWESRGQDLGGQGIVGKLHPDGEEFVVNTQRNLDQFNPGVGIDPSGRAIVVWANTLKSDTSIISAQQFLVGVEPTHPPAPSNLATTVNSTQSNQNLPAVASSPAAPTLPSPAPLGNPPLVTKVQNAPDTVVSQSEIMPQFPRFVSHASLAATQMVRSGSRVPGVAQGSSGQSGSVPARNAMKVFPTRASLNERSGNLAPGRAAVNALKEMGGNQVHTQYRLTQQSSASHNTSIARSGMRAQSNGSTTASRSSIFRASQSASFQPREVSATSRSGPRTGLRTPSASTPVARTGISLGSRINSRPSSQGTARSGGIASSRFELLRRQSQQATQQAGVARMQAVPAGLRVSGENISVNWQARQGARYQVQGSNDKSNWANYGTVKTGASNMSAQVSKQYRFYRVVVSD